MISISNWFFIMEKEKRREERRVELKLYCLLEWHQWIEALPISASTSLEKWDEIYFHPIVCKNGNKKEMEKQLLHSISVILRNLLSRFILGIFVRNKYSMTLEQLISPIEDEFSIEGRWTKESEKCHRLRQFVRFLHLILLKINFQF